MFSCPNYLCFYFLMFNKDADKCRRFHNKDVAKSEDGGGRAYRSLHDFAESNYLLELKFV